MQPDIATSTLPYAAAQAKEIGMPRSMNSVSRIRKE
jgi:hypothetical protein